MSRHTVMISLAFWPCSSRKHPFSRSISIPRTRSVAGRQSLTLLSEISQCMALCFNIFSMAIMSVSNQFTLRPVCRTFEHIAKYMHHLERALEL